jgi:hypothetical protein
MGIRLLFIKTAQSASPIAREPIMMMTHLLEHLGVPAAAATVVGIVALLVRVGLGAKGGPARGNRGRRPPGDGH